MKNRRGIGPGIILRRDFPEIRAINISTVHGAAFLARIFVQKLPRERMRSYLSAKCSIRTSPRRFPRYSTAPPRSDLFRTSPRCLLYRIVQTPSFSSILDSSGTEPYSGSALPHFRSECTSSSPRLLSSPSRRSSNNRRLYKIRNVS